MKKESTCFGISPQESTIHILLAWCNSFIVYNVTVEFNIHECLEIGRGYVLLQRRKPIKYFETFTPHIVDSKSTLRY